MGKKFDPNASSSAGNQVQSEIILQIKRLWNSGNPRVSVISLKQMRTWPIGPIFWCGYRDSTFWYPPFINIFIVKRLFFSLFMLINLLIQKPNIIIKYNISFLEILAISIYRIISRSTYVVAIIQDVPFMQSNKFSINNLFVRLSIAMVSQFEFIVPISERIVSEFSLPFEKCRVFIGGLTRQGRDLMSRSDPIKSPPYAVFAGALESYNGIDILVEKWVSLGIALDLHIFGRGSQETSIKMIANTNKNIIFHGFKSEDEVSFYQMQSLINFCLRYSKGIDQNYFFPSKLFNIICAPGYVFLNDFSSLPTTLKDLCTIVNDDLSDLDEKIDALMLNGPGFNLQNLRKKWIHEYGSWNNVITDIRRNYENKF